MTPQIWLVVTAILGGTLLPQLALAESMAFKLLPNQSRATFKTDAPLETIVGNTAGEGVTGTSRRPP